MNALDKLTIFNGDKEEMATILFTFEDNGKKYVVFEFDETHEVSAAVYVPGETASEGQLFDIETDAEWDLVDKVYNQYEEDLEAAEDEEDSEA